MSQTAVEYPRWVVDLNNPPLPKSKTSGIVDPPGFQSQTPSTSKVSCRTTTPSPLVTSTSL